MKKIVYLAPLALLGMSVKVSANQVPTHISNALRVYEQEYNQTQTASQSTRRTKTEQVGQNGSTFSNNQNQPIGKAEETTHISRLDNGLINEDSSVGNEQASQVMQIGRTVIPTKQELSESKESVAGQYVQVQQNRVAQFNKGSKIYGLNNSGQLSKNNGDGYVITNAGTYNGRAVDIGVTVNDIRDNQGLYTTKWSNGDKANVTGKVDNQFNYQNGVTVNSDALQPVAPNQTRTRTENKQVTVPVNGLWVLVDWSHSYGDDGVTSNDDQYLTNSYIVDPKLIGDIMQQTNCNYQTALSKLGINLDKMTKTHAPINIKTSHTSESGSYVDLYEDGGVTDFDGGQTHVIIYHVNFDNNSKIPRTFVDGADDKTYVNVDLLRWPGGKSNDTNNIYYDDPIADPGYPDGTMAGANGIGIGVSGSDAFDLVTADNKFDATKGDYQISWMPEYSGDDSSGNHYSVYRSSADQTGIKYIRWYSANDIAKYIVPDDQAYKVNVIQPINVTDHLQIDQINQGSLNYDYTVGVYDAQTGELIKDLTAEYKGKTGKTATDQDIAMNNAIKAKIQAINNNTANSAYTGTAASDDVTFSKNTVHVNYVDTRGESINVPGYDIDVDNLASGNYQVPKNYALANTNGFKVTKNTHEVNGVTVTDSYNFIDQGNNKVTDNSRTLSVVLEHDTRNVDPIHSGLSNDAAANTFVINNGAKRQINSQSRHFGASGILDLVTNKITKQGDWQLLGESNFDQTNINNDLVGYGNAIHSNLTFLTL